MPRRKTTSTKSKKTKPENLLSKKQQTLVSKQEPQAPLVTVTFLTEGKSVAVPEGSTILDAAIAAGVFINSVCGGMGRCGKCKISATGLVKAESSELITKSERARGISLACTTKVFGDVEVKIPAASKVDIHQILTRTELVHVETPRPLIENYFLRLTEPTFDDTVSDLNRLKNELVKAAELDWLTPERILTPVGVLRKIPELVRKNDWQVTVTAALFEEYFEIIDIAPGDTSEKDYGICVDIGTTTIVVELIDLNTGKSLGTKSNYNKQKVCGEDVLSRIMYAEEHGVKKLQELVIENINFLINELMESTESESGKIRKEDIFYIVLAGNTTMTHMFLGLDPITIRREPYIPVLNSVPPLKAHELNLDINPEAIVYCLPSRASWVGGDITADILASNLHCEKELSLLIDVGTNGEVVLGNSDWMMTCSCSAGPAFEGGEVQFGMNASSGAIEKVFLTEELDVKYKTINNKPPKGLCGSGLIDLMAELFTHKVLDRNGKFKSMDIPRLQMVNGERVFIVVFADETGFEHKKDIYITETDIKNIIRTKGAVYGACQTLLKLLGYTFDDVANIFIAGGFGNYLDTTKSIMLGLLPDVPLDKFKYIGNGSLAGTYLVLLSEDKKCEAEDIFEKLTYMELSVRNDFYNEFVSALFLPHTNLDLFPTVKKIV
ncbi:ASKHA domain-containing protein [[Eubacterium] cellulosolvens]